MNFSFEAQKRDDQGKGASRRLRREGLVPSIIYGGDKEPVAVSLIHNEVVKALSHEAFYTSVIEISVGKSKEKALVRDIQRHPFKPVISHMDFQRIDPKKAMKVHVPLHFINEATCAGVKNSGGSIAHHMADVEVLAKPADLPEFIEVDLASLEVGATIHLSDLKLPKGVKLVELTHGEGHDQAVVTVNAPKGASTEETPAAE